MIALVDINKTLRPPACAEFQSVAAIGSFLRLTYVIQGKGGYLEIEIYLNDQGREVLRTANAVETKWPDIGVDKTSVFSRAVGNLPEDHPDDYCSRCNKIVLRPNIAYGVNPDAVCNCMK
jgi:hypothetical protein